MKSPEGLVLSSIALTTPRPRGGWSQTGRVRVAGLQGDGSDDKPSVQLFVDEDC